MPTELVDAIYSSLFIYFNHWLMEENMEPLVIWSQR